MLIFIEGVNVVQRADIKGGREKGKYIVIRHCCGDSYVAGEVTNITFDHIFYTVATKKRPLKQGISQLHASFCSYSIAQTVEVIKKYICASRHSRNWLKCILK